MDLRTTYLGLELKKPLVASPSPLSRELANLRRMEDAGASAVVLYSLFEEEINQESHALDRYLSDGTESFAEALTYFPEAPAYRAIGPDAYLEHIFRAKQAVNIPVIASLNGVSTGGWIRYAKEMEGAGADALELNIYYVPTRLDLSSAEVEDIYLNLVRDVRASSTSPSPSSSAPTLAPRPT